MEKTCGKFALINSTWTQWQNMPQTMKKGVSWVLKLTGEHSLNWPLRRERLGKRPFHFGYLDRSHVMRAGQENKSWNLIAATKLQMDFCNTWSSLPFKSQRLHS